MHGQDRAEERWLDQVFIPAQLVHQQRQGLSFERIEVFVSSSHRIPQASPAVAGREDDGSRVKAELLVEKLVRVKDIKVVTVVRPQPESPSDSSL